MRALGKKNEVMLIKNERNGIKTHHRCVFYVSEQRVFYPRESFYVSGKGFFSEREEGGFAISL